MGFEDTLKRGEREIDRLLHREQQTAIPQEQSREQPQETRMTTRISDAKAAIDRASQQLASLTGNQLAEAIADAGIGTSFTPGDVGLVLAVIRAIEHGPGLATVTPAQETMTPAVSFSAATPPPSSAQQTA